MQSEKFQDPNWYKALTLTERLDCFPEIRMQNLDNQNIKGKPNERLLRWREQSPFNVDNWFDLRLRSVGISQNEFKWILSQEPACFKVVSSKLPSWLAELSEAYTPSNSKNSILENFLFEFSDKKDYQQNRQNYEFQKFLILVEPLLSLELNQLNGALNELHQIHPKVLFNPVEVEKTIIASLSSDLLQIISRTLVLELNVARLNGILKGKTSSDRFEHFTNLLVNKDFTIQLLLEYPVLSKILVTYIKQTFQNCIEFITRLFEDWRILDTTFQLHDAYLTGLWPFGDRHKGGKSVIIATFSSRKKIVYKPRSLAVDAHFQALLNWFNNYYDYPLFKELGIIDQGEYGWVEFVEHKNCTSEIEIQRFYERLGAYLALLHMIDATDFHFENLIASGEYPVLIDLETLWHRSLSDQVIINKTHAEQIAGSIILNSVMRVGLLPQQLWMTDDFSGVDFSGLGADQDQLLSPNKVIRYRDIGTDEMRVSRERVKVLAKNHRPNVNGVFVDPLDFISSINYGFTKMYRLILKHRKLLQSKDGPLEKFANDKIRILVRSSQSYAVLMNEGYHPNLLRDALDLELHFDHLWANINDFPAYEALIPSERKSLWEGDIPYFSGRPNSINIWSSSGDMIPGFFKETSLDHVRRQLKTLNEFEIERQSWFITASFASLATSKPKSEAKAEKIIPDTLIPLYDKNEYLSAAREVGNRLEKLAIWGEDDCCWIGLSPVLCGFGEAPDSA